MAPPPRRGSWAARPGAAWVLLCAALALGALAGALLPAPVLDWRPALAATEPWRAWTAAFVHLSPRHLVANLLGCAAVAAFGWMGGVPPRAALAWLLAWPLGHALLALQPALAFYGGLSGVLHGGAAIAALCVAAGPTRRERIVGALVFAGLLAKLVNEKPWLGPVRQVPGWDIPIAPIAHATGAAAAVACLAAVAAVQALHRRRRHHPREAFHD
ncbi:rhombosortase [Aquincola sp. MAHUQ-54]|uniref:Rhombosortase n=1 Tax=Aquincola agrisoli TaxID=3119538 RepID=A0AAW9QJ75_9BURK